MDAFEDKQQEIKQLINYIRLITKSSDPQWEVLQFTFSVTIQGKFNRTFSKAELESFEHQIEYLQTLEDSTDISLISKNQNYFEYFLKIIDNIRNRCKVCSQEFLYIHNPTFKENQYQYVEKMKDDTLTEEECEKFLFPPTSDKNSVKDDFNLGPKDYYEIGKIIIKSDLENETLNTVFNFFGFINVDPIMVKNFINSTLASMKSIDPIKIGRKFVEKLSKKAFENIDYSNFDERLKNKSFVKLTNFVGQLSEDQTLLIANVPKPGHVYHLIQPSYICWPDKRTKNYQCPPENILFCTEDNSFQDSLNKISNTNNGFLYFIVHPENLRSDEMQRLKTFISSRRSQNVKMKDDIDDTKTIEGAKSTPKVMIITSLPASFFNLEENNMFSFDDSLSFNEKDIQEFAIFNAQWRRMVCSNHNDIFLFSSSKTGIGKTYRIKRILNKAINKFKNMEEDEEEDLKFYQKDNECHIYFDITTNEIPEIIKENTFVHISISPELFLNNFQIFDQLYILIQYGFFIFQSGSHISYSAGRNIIPTFLIEIPNLDDEYMLKNFYDFPIAPSNNHQKYKWKSDITGKNYNIYDIITEEFDEIGVKENFKNGLFHLTTNNNQIPIDDENVKFLMSLIFDNCKDIKSYKDLIIKSKKF